MISFRSVQAAYRKWFCNFLFEVHLNRVKLIKLISRLLVNVRWLFLVAHIMILPIAGEFEISKLCLTNFNQWIGFTISFYYQSMYVNSHCMCPINWLRSFHWCHLLIKPKTTYAYIVLTTAYYIAEWSTDIFCRSITDMCISLLWYKLSTMVHNGINIKHFFLYLM